MYRKVAKIASLANNYGKLVMHDKTDLIQIAMSIGAKNWGDALNIPLVQMISGKKAVVAYDPLRDLFKIPTNNYPVYSVIGSVLGTRSLNHNLHIWGSGFISTYSKLHRDPCEIFAVRGPLTRDLLVEQGHYCPEIYGDPALLYPLYYRPDITKKYKLGIIPHYVDKKNPWIKLIGQDPSVLVLDVFDDINVFIDNLCSCEYIASSSLHGLIASDSYLVPSIWIELSNHISGDRFKYMDYFESVNRNDNEPIAIKGNESSQDIISVMESYNIKIDLHKLIDTCPFKKNNVDYSKMISSTHPLYV